MQQQPDITPQTLSVEKELGLVLSHHANVYEPAEDSVLLAKMLKKHTHENVAKILEIGVGSGVLTAVLAQLYPQAIIHGVDINEDALKLTHKNLKHAGFDSAIVERTLHGKFKAFMNKVREERITLFPSDIFDKADKDYDLIVCNPPYLPAHKFDPQDILTQALVGGKKGFEYIERFLNQAQEHLGPNGNIVFLFSTLSNKDVVESIIKRNLFDKKVLATQYVGMFETLFVYELQPLIHIHELIDAGYKNVEYLAHGKRGIVLTANKGWQKVAIKISKNTMQAAMLGKEVLFLTKANDIGIGPKIIDKTESFVTMEFIQGTLILDYIGTKSRHDSLKMLKKVFEQLHKLDKAGIEKLEMTNPYKHVIIKSNGDPVIIDFERCSFNPYPKNVTQFVQFVSSGKFNPPFIDPKTDELASLLKEYKFKHKDETFKKILSLLK
ncbi:MAG TPA: methyltransferase [Acidobacteriota bacterium]|nr:methyltransferase [Acidobacteriota bacterium]